MEDAEGGCILVSCYLKNIRSGSHDRDVLVDHQLATGERDCGKRSLCAVLPVTLLNVPAAEVERDRVAVKSIHQSFSQRARTTVICVVDRRECRAVDNDRVSLDRHPEFSCDHSGDSIIAHAQVDRVACGPGRNNDTIDSDGRV